MLKYSIEDTNDVDESLRDFYKPVEGQEGFHLDIDAYTDHRVAETNKSLEAKVNELLGEKKAEQKKRQEAEEKARIEAEEKARKDGNLEALEKSWGEKYSKLENSYSAQLQEKEAALKSATVDRDATELAALFTSPKVMYPHIRSRLDIEIKDGVAKTFVLDENGQRSALTPQELAKSFMEDDAFKSLVKASDASGAGGSNDSSSARIVPSKKSGEPLTTEERIQMRKAARGN